MLATQLTLLDAPAPVVEIRATIWGMLNGPVHLLRYDTVNRVWVAVCNDEIKIRKPFEEYNEKPAHICPECAKREG